MLINLIAAAISHMIGIYLAFKGDIAGMYICLYNATFNYLIYYIFDIKKEK